MGKRRRGDGGAGAPAELEGVVHGDGLYLLDRATGRVYDGMARDADGQPKLVGEWVDEAVVLNVHASDSPGSGAGDAAAEGARGEGGAQEQGQEGQQQQPKLSKKALKALRRKELEEQQREASKPTPKPAHPFVADDRDHCETAVEAYADVASILSAHAKRLGVSDAKLRVYDPYYCNGAVKANLASLGFETVHNECEDFYAVAAAGKVPEFDVLVTNPPYSADHVAKLLDFVEGPLCAGAGRPALMLMPNWVVDKDYYATFAARVGGGKRAREVAYVAPKKRYSYWAPRGWRVHKHTHSGPKGEKTSPFVSFWYMVLGDKVRFCLPAATQARARILARALTRPARARARRRSPPPARCWKPSGARRASASARAGAPRRSRAPSSSCPRTCATDTTVTSGAGETGPAEVAACQTATESAASGIVGGARASTEGTMVPRSENTSDGCRHGLARVRACPWHVGKSRAGATVVSRAVGRVRAAQE